MEKDTTKAFCDRCIFSCDVTANFDKTFHEIECRRHAPTVSGDVSWPTVRPNDWCGEFVDDGSLEFDQASYGPA